MPPKRRSRLDIEASILSALSNDEMTMNKIVTHINLNRKLAKKYVEELSGTGLLRVQNNKKFDSFSTTEKGIEWLTRYRSLMREVRSVPLIPDKSFQARY